jgi:hypothetical protein
MCPSVIVNVLEGNCRRPHDGPVEQGEFQAHTSIRIGKAA